MPAIVVILLLLLPLGSAQLFGTGCLGVNVQPSPGSALGAQSEWTFLLTFSDDTSVLQGSGSIPLNSCDSTCFASIQSSRNLINLTSADGAVSVLPTHYLSQDARTLSVTFQTSSLLGIDTLVLHIGYAFVLAASPARVGLPAQGWMTYARNAPVVQFSPPPQVPCPTLQSTPELISPVDDSSSIECNGAADCVLTVRMPLPLGQNSSIRLPSTTRSSQGDVYQLSRGLDLAVIGSLIGYKFSLGVPTIFSPSFETLNDPLNMVEFKDYRWKDISREEVQNLLNLVNLPPSDRPLVRINNQPYNPLDDPPLEVDIIESNPPGWRANLTFPNSSTLFLLWDKLDRSGTYWFYKWHSESLGVVCPRGSYRNSACPTCNGVRHSWGSLPTDSWTAFSVHSMQNFGGVDSVMIDGVACEAPNCSPSFSFPAAPNFVQMKLVTRNVYERDPSLQDVSEWMWLSDSHFGGGCGKLDTDMRDFVRQPDFCSSSFESCLGQLGIVKQSSSNFIVQQFGPFSSMSDSTGGPLIQLNTTNRELTVTRDSNTVEFTTRIQLAHLDLHILQPKISVQTQWITPNASEPLTRVVSITAENQGDIDAPVQIDLVCLGAEAAPVITTIDKQSTKIVSVNITLSEPKSMVSISCSGTLTTPGLPYWDANELLVDAPPLVLELTEQGCWTTPPSASLLVPAAEWMGAIGDLFAEGGLLGPNPTNLNTTGTWSTPRNSFSSIAQFSLAVIHDSFESTNVTFAIECTSSHNIIATTPIVLPLPANTLSPVQLPYILEGAESDCEWQCRLNVTLHTPQCANRIGTSFSQPFTTFVPASPCYQEHIDQPYLFISPDDWQDRQNESIPAELMTTSLVFGWNAKPNSASAWSELGLQDTERTEYQWLTQFGSRLFNSGNASGTFYLLISCDETAPPVSRNLSVTRCELGPQEGCDVRITFIANDTRIYPDPFRCVFIAQIAIPDYECWLPIGKTYLQQVSLALFSAATPISTETKSKWLGMPKAGAVALIVVLCIVGVAFVVVLVALFATKLINQQGRLADEECKVVATPQAPENPFAIHIEPNYTVDGTSGENPYVF